MGHLWPHRPAVAAAGARRARCLHVPGLLERLSLATGGHQRSRQEHPAAGPDLLQQHALDPLRSGHGRSDDGRCAGADRLLDLPTSYRQGAGSRRYAVGQRSVSAGHPARGELLMQAVLNEIDVEQYARDGYLTAPSVLSPEELAILREEADRVLAICAAEPERYASRIQWERDHLDSDDQRGMDRVIR